MTIWGHFCCLGYGLQARVHAVGHMWRGHRVRWRADTEIWVGLTGDIICKDCDLVMWSRFHPWLQHLMQWLCGRLGHPGVRPGRCDRCAAVWSP